MREKQKTRKLKVYGQSGYKYQDTPTIVLKGKWLTDAGFNIGSDLMVGKGQTTRLSLNPFLVHT